MISFKNITYTYPFANKPAVKNINFTVSKGEIVLCTGASGSGKSTLIRLLNGLCPHYYKGTLEGIVTVDGENTAEKTMAEISSKVGTLFQDPEQQFFALNVDDELAFALEWKGYESAHIGERITAAAKMFGIEDIMQSPVNKLSEGQKQKVGLASLFTHSPSVVILDEPTANLDPESVESLTSRLLEMKAAGITVFVADHRLYWLRNIADKVIVMSGGEIAMTGTFHILDDKSVREKYGLRLSTVPDRRRELPDCQNQPPMLTAKSISFSWNKSKKIFNNATFSLPSGITALIGENGVGKTTLARLVTGLTKPESGSFAIDGVKISPKILSVDGAIVLQNADHQLYMKTVLQEVETCLSIAGKSDIDEAHTLLKLFDLEGLIHRHPQSLSGGEKQRLVIACAFAKKPKLLILDEPTSGLDGGNMKRMANAIKKFGEQGTVTLVITHDLELMNNVCTYGLQLPIN